MTEPSKIRTCLWFDDQGEEAAEFYVSLLPGSFIETVSRPNPDGPALVVEFTLAGAPYMTLNGGPHFELTPAASISVLTKDQDETDQLWERLTENGGKEASADGLSIDLACPGRSSRRSCPNSWRPMTKRPLNGLMPP